MKIYPDYIYIYLHSGTGSTLVRIVSFPFICYFRILHYVITFILYVVEETKINVYFIFFNSIVIFHSIHLLGSRFSFLCHFKGVFQSSSDSQLRKKLNGSNL